MSMPKISVSIRHRIDVLDVSEDPAYRDEFMRWVQYFAATEEYDRTVCSGWMRDQAWPTNAKEQRLITANARRVLAALDLQVTKHPRAKRDASELSYAHCIWLIEQDDSESRS